MRDKSLFSIKNFAVGSRSNDILKNVNSIIAFINAEITLGNAIEGSFKLRKGTAK